MGIDSPVHLIFIAAVALIVLGPKRLPGLARALGEGIREFRQSLEDGASGVEPSPPATPAPPVATISPAPSASTATPVPAPPSQAADSTAAPPPPPPPPQHPEQSSAQ
jgi:TatA/E family protein of Tat protein translocase